MYNSEIACQLTLKALEENLVCVFKPDNDDSEAEIEKKNSFNAKQISDFYGAIVSSLK